MDFLIDSMIVISVVIAAVVAFRWLDCFIVADDDHLSASSSRFCSSGRKWAQRVLLLGRGTRMKHRRYSLLEIVLTVAIFGTLVNLVSIVYGSRVALWEAVTSR